MVGQFVSCELPYFFIELICRIKKNCYLDIIGISETPQQKYFKNFIELVWSIQK